MALRRLIAIVVSSYLVLVVGMVIGQSADAVRRGGTLVVGKEAEATGLDPHMSIGFSSREIQELVYDSLVTVDPKMRVVPAVAESWESADGRVHTFRLRRNAKFHSGRPVTSQDVKYSFERIVAVRSPRAGRVADVERIETPDPYTVVVTLRGPNAGFVANLACGIGGPQPLIVPQEEVDKQGNLQRVMVGTGPFTLKEYVPDNFTLMSRFGDYWQSGQPYLDQVRFEIMPDEASRLAAIRTGRIHLTELRQSSNIEIARKIPGAKVLRSASMNFYSVMFNTSKKPFDDVRVRKAVELAIDRQEVMTGAVGKDGELLGVLPPILKDWAVSIVQLDSYKPNLQKAKALLGEAGYSNGWQGSPLVYVVSEQFPLLVRNAEIIQQQLNRIGLGVTIQRVEWADYIRRWRASEFDLINELTAAGCDPVGLEDDFRSTGPKAVHKLRDPELDSVLDRARRATSPILRKQLYREAQFRILEDAPKLHLYAPTVSTAIMGEVEGFQQYPTEWRLSLGRTWLRK